MSFCQQRTPGAREYFAQPPGFTYRFLTVTPERFQLMPNHAVVRQALRFAVVGSIATGVHYAILIALVVEIGHVKPLIATTFGYCFGVITSYTLNRRFTFRDTAAPVA